MSKENKMSTVTFQKREVKGEMLAEGVFQYQTRTKATSYLLRCHVTNEWCYCSQDRFDKLLAKAGSVEAVGAQHLSREGKRKYRDEKKEMPAMYAATKRAPRKKKEKPEKKTELVKTESWVANTEYVAPDEDEDIEISREIAGEVDHIDIDNEVDLSEVLEEDEVEVNS